MIVYKYFLGCTNYIEVKSRYRELAKQYHPDKPTGNKVTFQELVDEYSMLGEGDYYPLRNITKFESVIDKAYNRYYPKTPSESFTHINPEEVEKQKAEAFFASLRLSDITFDYLDSVINQATKERLNKLWVYQEVQKKWDLDLNHFKYVTFKMKDKVSIAKELYRKYQLNVV